MSLEPKTCRVCFKPSEKEYNLCKNCWLALKLLDYDFARVKRALKYLGQIARKTRHDLRASAINQKSPIARAVFNEQDQRKDLQTEVKRKTQQIQQVEKERIEGLRNRPKTIKIIKRNDPIRESNADLRYAIDNELQKP